MCACLENVLYIYAMPFIAFGHAYRSSALQENYSLAHAMYSDLRSVTVHRIFLSIFRYPTTEIVAAANQTQPEEYAATHSSETHFIRTKAMSFHF